MTTITAPKTLAFSFNNEFLKTKAGQATLVAGFALFTALMAQVSIKLSFTPVPITGQTFAVLASGAIIGSRLGAASQLLYFVLGMFLPFYAEYPEGMTKFEVAFGSTFGYLFGFIIASYVVGLMAEKQNDRTVYGALASFVVGSAIIYTFGALWLSHSLNIPLVDEMTKPNAIALGVAPFLVGDFIKAVIAAALLPTAWKLIPKKD